MVEKIILIVLDSVGIGELPDAKDYGDEGSNTLGNMAKALGGLDLPNLEMLGIGKIEPIVGISPDIAPKGFYGKMAEVSAGKDTTSGHWEIAGIITDKPFPTYPEGFPDEIINAFTKEIGRKILGNKPASGTEIIKELGEEHIRTCCPIIYTSADSVFQVAACEDVIPVPELYRMCEIARRILSASGGHNVGRVIARPFIIQEGKYIRTERRKDFSVLPPSSTILDSALEKGYEVIGIGKIGDIFAHRGLSLEIHTAGNDEGVSQTINCIKRKTKGIIFTNLIDFDMKYGHRNDVKGYAQALKEFDNRLPEIMDAMGSEDILAITADHGCDPTTPSTDHSREYVPLLVYGCSLGMPKSLGIRKTFADLGATVAEALSLPQLTCGESFLGELITGG
ncbi:MAG TPA: phosphopentomutase [Candidatus Brocadiia bacterium]|nr:phosphopentomutase [Planctomycetota bacterium]MDO8092548.1 phosphopentomutase [Candidatus Brocadiales bacterium]